MNKRVNCITKALNFSCKKTDYIGKYGLFHRIIDHGLVKQIKPYDITARAIRGEK